LHRVFDMAELVLGVAAATALVAKGAHDARTAGAWPRWLELTYVVAVLVAVPAVLVAAWARLRVRRHGIVIVDERTVGTHLQSMGVALIGVLAVQLPYFFRVEISSLAQAQFTVAAALVVYGVARLWFNREA
jgi:hypothetical protein